MLVMFFIFRLAFLAGLHYNIPIFPKGRSLYVRRIKIQADNKGLFKKLLPQADARAYEAAE